MKQLAVDLPTMYGDHHVLEIRRILDDTPGIEDLYASSAFQTLQLKYDDKKTVYRSIKKQ